MISSSKKIALGLLCFMTATACYRVPNKLEPQISYLVQDKYICALESSFPTLTKQEREQEWGKEYFIGIAFAKKLDLYRAVTAFKRAEILIPDHLYHRKQEVEYYELLSYYLGKRYEEVLDTFDDSSLCVIDSTFPTYHDLLVILYECYLHTDKEDKANNIVFYK
jgi:tetratricopeptide (TPR) repeat protein